MNRLAMNPCRPPDEANTLHANADKLQTRLQKAIQNRNIALVHKRLAEGATHESLMAAPLLAMEEARRFFLAEGNPDPQSCPPRLASPRL